MTMTRDEFSKGTSDILAKRVGTLCSNPTCKCPTSGPHTESKKAVNVGVAAHISAASAGGPRYDGALTPEQRRDIGNGIWLCQNCAKLVDNDAARFPTSVLRAWKALAEQEALAEIENRLMSFSSPDPIQVVSDGWEAWRERGNRPGDSVIFIGIWAAGDIRYSFTLRFRNTQPQEEQLYKAAVQFRLGSQILFEDFDAIPGAIVLPSQKWVMHDLDYGIRKDKHDSYAKADSVWLVADILGGGQRIEHRVTRLNHATPLRTFD